MNPPSECRSLLPRYISETGIDALPYRNTYFNYLNKFQGKSRAADDDNEGFDERGKREKTNEIVRAWLRNTKNQEVRDANRVALSSVVPRLPWRNNVASSACAPVQDSNLSPRAARAAKIENDASTVCLYATIRQPQMRFRIREEARLLSERKQREEVRMQIMKRLHDRFGTPQQRELSHDTLHAAEEDRATPVVPQDGAPSGDFFPQQASTGDSRRDSSYSLKSDDSSAPSNAGNRRANLKRPAISPVLTSSPANSQHSLRDSVPDTAKRLNDGVAERTATSYSRSFTPTSAPLVVKTTSTNARASMKFPSEVASEAADGSSYSGSNQESLVTPATMHPRDAARRAFSRWLTKTRLSKQAKTLAALELDFLQLPSTVMPTKAYPWHFPHASNHRDVSRDASKETETRTKMLLTPPQPSLASVPQSAYPWHFPDAPDHLKDPSEASLSGINVVAHPSNGIASTHSSGAVTGDEAAPVLDADEYMSKQFRQWKKLRRQA